MFYITSMDTQSSSKINCMFMPTLKHLAFVKLASMLWNKTDVRYLISEYFSYERGIDKIKCLEIENTVIPKVPELQLPRELENSLTSYIHPVGFKIFTWLYCHKVNNIAFEELPSEFFWTPQGNIDNRKVAKTLVNDKRLKIYVRYKFACIHCLEEYIYLLFNELPKGFHKNPEEEPIVRYWSYYVAGEIDQLLKFYHDTLGEGATFWQVGLGFQIPVVKANWEATMFFFQKCTSEERAELLLKTATSECIRLDVPGRDDYRFSDTLCYLLSEMNADEQSKLATNCASTILYYLLHWPWQNFFLRVVKKKETFLLPEDFYSLLQTIVRKICVMPHEFNYENIFSEFWQLSSTVNKRYVILKGGLQSMSYTLYSKGNIENIKLIFKESTMVEKEKFIFSSPGLLICQELIKVSNFKLLEFFIQECISSETIDELKEKLKKLFLSLSSSIDFIEIIHLLNRFYQIFDIEKKKYINDVQLKSLLVQDVSKI